MTIKKAPAKRKKVNFEHIGSFQVCSKLVVSDPGYQLGTWCAGEISMPRHGKWNAYVLRKKLRNWGERIAKLLIIHEDEGGPDKKRKWVWEAIDVGVDSGQAGFFDLLWYRKNKKIVPEDLGEHEGVCKEEPFYHACGTHTLSKKQAGCLSHGALSSSGIGDGSYNCYSFQGKDKRVVAAYIDFGL